jgi:UDP-N-acetylmuramoyl-tripeptide--D-alanyl-D-alanine ligase
MMLSATEIAQATAGLLIADGPAGPIGTDTRRLSEGMWFLALTGDRFDGHDYLPMAGAAGCAGVIAERVPDGWEHGFVQVADGLTALQDLARFVRARFTGPVVGITGSAGKTTTRALAALALAPLGVIHATEGNLNNHVGLPLTILAAPVDAAAWVVEMGMSGFGEIDLLQDIAAPTIRVITNAGAAHTEGVGDLDGVARAKGELFAGARPGDICILNADDTRIAALPIPEGARALRYGSQLGCDVRLTDAVVEPTTMTTRYRIEVADEVVLGTLPTPGAHLASNAAAAVAIAVALHVPLAGMAARLAQYEPVGMRLRVEAGPMGTRVLNDAYNANPLSTAATLRTLATVPGRKVALLGDMLELGPGEIDAHVEVLRLALELDVDLIGTAGPRYAAAGAELSAATHAAGRPDTLHRWVAAQDAEALAAAVANRLQPGDTVLVKGSRGLAMERVLRTLSSLTGEEG